MNPNSTLVLMTVSFALSAVGVGLVRRWAINRVWLDLPNERSLHRTPIPRGGGLAVAAVILGGIVVIALAGGLPPRVAVGLGGGGLIVAATGWLDDRQRLATLPRVLAHFAAAGWALAWLGGYPLIELGFGPVRAGWIGSLIALLGIVWSINFYNFMDGIDGLAAGEAMCVGLIGGVLLNQAGQPGLAAVALLTAATATGFLPWNLPPARIFLGDVGSGLFGFLFGALAVASENAGGPPALAWGVLLGVFIFDATVTLIRRLLRGERWYAAHRSHAYQRLVQSGWSHGKVSGACLALTIFLGALAAVGCRTPGLWPVVITGGLCLLTAAYIGVERKRPM